MTALAYSLDISSPGGDKCCTPAFLRRNEPSSTRKVFSVCLWENGGLPSSRTFLHSKQPVDRFGIVRRCAGCQQHGTKDLSAQKRKTVEYLP
jgi:hypothetical protein